MKQQIHITKKTEEICKKLRQNGFNGIRFEDVHIEKEKAEDYKGELTKKQFIERQKHYLCFIAQPAFYGRLGWDDEGDGGLYITREVNETQFYKDFMDYLKQEFGNDVTINFHKGCFEYEVYRESGRYCYDHFHPEEAKLAH